MKYLVYTHVDSKTNIPVNQAPARRGPKTPNVPGLQYGFALESEYPTDYPKFYGTCPDGTELQGIPGVISEITQEQYQEVYNKELDARKEQSRRRVEQARDQVLFGSIEYTFPGDTEPDHIQVRDERDRQNIQDNVIDAGNRDPEETMYFMPMSNNLKTLTAAQLVDMGKFLKTRGDSIYQVAWDKKAELSGIDTFEQLNVWGRNLDEGWPE